MMHGIGQIFSKEMARIFRDRKMVFSVFLLPVLIMVVIMTIVSNLAGRMESDIASHTPIVWMQNEPESFRSFLKTADTEYEIRYIGTDGSMEEARAEVLDGSADLLLLFPENFDTLIEDYQTGDIPQIMTCYNPSEDYSSRADQEISGTLLESYRQTLLARRMGDPSAITVFTVNTSNEDRIIQDEDKAGGQILGMMLPYFITILLFAGAMGIGTDMIAGEKERGTMASLLVAPVRRSAIVLGKVFALMVLSGISSVIYMAGLVVGMPFMMKSMSGLEDAVSLRLDPGQIVMLGLLLIALAFLYSAVIALISVFARTTKEAGSYIMPAYMIVLVVGLLTMFRTGDGSPWDYYIPFYNSAVSLQTILSHEITIIQYVTVLAETLALGGILTVLIARAFNNEKIMAL